MHAVDRPTIRAGRHCYQLGVSIGEHSLWAQDEHGQVCMAHLARKTIIESHVDLAVSLGGGILAEVYDHGDLSGGRWAFLVTEWIKGYSLGSLIQEGRRLSVDQVRRMAQDLGGLHEAVQSEGQEIRAVHPGNIVFDTTEAVWRVAFIDNVVSYDRYPVADNNFGWIATAMDATGDLDAGLLRAMDAIRKGRLTLRDWMRMLEAST